MNTIIDVSHDFNDRSFRVMSANMLVEFIMARSRNELKKVKHILSSDLYIEEEARLQNIENNEIYNYIDIVYMSFVRDVGTDTAFVAVMAIDFNSNVGDENNNRMVKERFLVTFKKEIKTLDLLSQSRCPNCNSIVDKSSNMACKHCGALYNITTDGWIILSVKKQPYVDEYKSNFLFTLILIGVTATLTLKYQEEIFNFIDDVYNSEYFLYGVLGLGTIVVLYIVISLIRFLSRKTKSYNSNSTKEESVRALIPEYNRGSFETSLYKVYEYIQYSKAGYYTDNVKKYVTDELFKNYNAEINFNKKKKYVHVIKDMKLENITIVDYGQNDSSTEASFFANISFVEYLTKKKGKIISGDINNRVFMYYKLTFIKQNSVDGLMWRLSEVESLERFNLID